MNDMDDYREMVRENPDAMFAISLAADAVFASTYGSCDNAKHSDTRWMKIAVRLRDKYGESLTADSLDNEMERAWAESDTESQMSGGLRAGLKYRSNTAAAQDNP